MICMGTEHVMNTSPAFEVSWNIAAHISSEAILGKALFLSLRCVWKDVTGHSFAQGVISYQIWNLTSKTKVLPLKPITDIAPRSLTLRSFK